MKILLTAINAKYIHSNLAVYSLRAYAEKYGEKADEKTFLCNGRNDLCGDVFRLFIGIAV